MPRLTVAAESQLGNRSCSRVSTQDPTTTTANSTTTRGMDAGAKKLLETVTIETLHAHHFSRASTQATNVLTDLLSRYLTALSSTCAKYAEHAGRLRLTARDAADALDELGVGIEELSEYCTTEGREMARYTVHTGRRLEDLNEFKGQSGRAASSSAPMTSVCSCAGGWSARR